MADENYAIKVQFLGIGEAIADFEKLQNAVANIKAPVINLGGADATKIAEAALKKLQLEIDALEAKKAQSAANDLSRADQLAAKQEQSAQRLLGQLEKQEAIAQRRLTQGNQNGNNPEEKDAIRRAKIYEEEIRLKQQLNQIRLTAFSPEDRAKAEAFANSISKINVQKIDKEFAMVNVGTRTFIGNMQDASAQLQVLAGKLNEIKGNASAAFLELDTARKKLSTISDDANGLVKALGEVGRANANQATTAQLAGAAYEVQSAGFSKTADTVKILDASLKGSVGGFSNVTTVSKATISVLNAYGLSADQAAATVDKFTAVQQSGLITVDQYASQISRVAPVAAAAGVSLDQLNGFIATATASGVPVESTFAGLRQALASTIKPSSDATKEAERLGIQFGATALRTKGLNGILADVAKSGKATGDTFSKLFGSIEAVAAIQPAINDLGKLEANIRASGESAGLTQKNFDKAKSTLVGFANEAQNALATLGEKINQTAIFNPLIGGARLLVSAFQAIPSEAQSLIAIVVGLGASFVGVSAVITGLLAVTTPTIAAFKTLVAAFAANTVATNATAAATGTASASMATLGATSQTASVGINKAAIATGLLKAALGGLVIFGAIESFNTFNNVLGRTGRITKEIDDAYKKYIETLKTPLPDTFGTALGAAGALDTKKALERQRKEIFDNLTFFEKTNAVIVDGLNSYDRAVGFKGQAISRGAVDIALEDQKIGFGDAITRSDLLAKANQERINALAKGEKFSQRQLSDTNEAIQANIRSVQNLKVLEGDEVSKFAKQEQLKFLDRQLDQYTELTTKIDQKKKVEVAAITEVTDAQRKQAIELKETKNQDKEKNLKRIFDDEKLKLDIANKKVIEKIEEENTKKKGDLDRKQAIETESLKTKQQNALQDKQKAFDDIQNAKKLAREQAIDDKKIANENKLNALKQAFDDRQNAIKEARAEKQRKDDEAFALARSERDRKAADAISERDRKNSEASTGAKLAIENEGKIATADPKEKAKIAAQIAEENRIRNEAKSQGQGGVLSQDQLIAQAKQLARVQAITTAEEQTKVSLALAELEKANSAKQAEIDKATKRAQDDADKAEESKRAEEKRAADKAFELQQQTEKRAFDEAQNVEKLRFEREVLTPEKLKLEQELQAQKLNFERTELAALKTQQAQQERDLKLKQETEDAALKKASDAQIDAAKAKQKADELILDRKFEDEKIERERKFKEQQRALDKASAIEIQQILGKSAQQIIDALATVQGGTAFGSALGAGTGSKVAKGAGDALLGGAKPPAFASGVTNFVGGAALVGERGAELVTLPRGANVIPANQTRNVLNSGGNKTYTFNITNAGDPMAAAYQIQREIARSDALASGI